MSKAHHQHTHHSISNQVNDDTAKTALYISIILNLVYVIMEAFYGIATKSMSLLSDAGHNFLDVLCLVLSLLSFWLIKKKATHRYTFGYKKAGILIALFNAALLLITIVCLLIESVLRIKTTPNLEGKTIAIIAIIGVFINGISAWFLYQSKSKNLNIKASFLHLMADAAISFGVTIGGIIIYYTNWFWIDAALSILICILLLKSTWSLFFSSLKMSLDAIPDSVCYESIKQDILSFNEIEKIQRLHIWALSTNENALTTTLQTKINKTEDIEVVKNKIKQALTKQNIQQSFIEFTANDYSE